MARGNYDRLKTDDRVPGKQILPEVQRRKDTLVSADGFSAYQVVLGPSTVDPPKWDDRDGDL